MYSLFLSALLAATPAPTDSAASYEGRVYVDANANGRHDRGEKFLGDVLVSDGLHVVRTTRSGRYRLPRRPGARFVFISTPSGYVAEPFFRPVRGNQGGGDFGLRPYDVRIGRDGAHSFVHLSDTEISSAAGQDDWLDDLRAYAGLAGAAFIVHTGDICYEKGLRAHRTLMNADNMGRPVYYCIGNHDLVKGSRGEALYESIYGPAYYSFNAGRTHYVVTPMRGGDYQPGYTMTDVCRWLENDLAQLPEGTPVVLFNHDYWEEGGRHVLKDGKGLSIDLDARGLKGWLFGHWHVNQVTRPGGVAAVCTSTPARGGIDHAVSAFRTLHVDGAGRLRSELRYAHVAPDVTLASVSDGSLARSGEDGSLALTVNAYATAAPVTDVACDVLLDRRAVVRHVPLRRQTDFAWHAPLRLPREYDGRTLTLRATARFADGQVRVREASFTPPAAASAAPRTGADWTNFGGGADHAGMAADTLRLPLRPLWVTNLGGTVYMASPVVKDGRVFCATTDENAEGRAAVVAVDARTGQTCWRFATRASVKGSIAVARGLVFAQDAAGWLYAIDTADGSLAWEKKLRVTLLPALDSGLAATDSVVYAGAGAGLCAVDAATGHVRWEGGGWRQREGTTATLSVDGPGGVVVGGVQWSGMYANDTRSGRLLWSRTDSDVRHRASSPAVHGGLLYFVSAQSFLIVSAAMGDIVARRELPFSADVTSTPLLTPDEIVFGTATEGLVALDRRTLREKWRFRTGEAVFYTAPYVAAPAATVESSPVGSGDVVFAGASDGVLYALSRHDGSLLWRHRTGTPLLSSPAVSGDMLFFADYAGNLYGFASADGR